MATDTDINKRARRFSRAAKAENIAPPEMAQKTKAVRLLSPINSDVLIAIVKQPAGEGDIIEARLDADEGVWVNETDYLDNGSAVGEKVCVQGEATETDYLYECIVSHTSGGGEAWESGLSWTENQRVSHEGDAYICILDADAGIGAPDVATEYWSLDNDNPPSTLEATGNAWETYWEKLDNLQVKCSILGNGENLNEAVPRLLKEDKIFVKQISSAWWCISMFNSSVVCTCTEPS